jgi:hypothetical protein
MAKAKAKQRVSATAANTAPGRAFKVVRNVTLPVLPVKIEEPVYVTIKDAMRVGAAQKEVIDKQTGKPKPKMEPATVCTVVDLMTGEVKTLIVAAVVKGIFEDEYAGETYVGKSFCLVKHAKKEGKNYFNYSVDEIDADQPTGGV